MAIPQVLPEQSSAEPRWTSQEATTLDSLLEVAGWTRSERTARGVPWEAGHELHYSAVGGMHSRDRRRISVAGDSYNSRVDGDRRLAVAGDMTVDIDSNTVLSVSPSGSGQDRMHVKGDMSWHFHDKMILGTGTVNRTWYGPVTRFIGMEGIICGGAYLKAFLGGSMTMGAVASGDVFGGAARTAGARVYVAGIGYRSCDNALWQLGAYVRTTHCTIEPLMGSPSGTKPFNSRNHVAKLAGRISMAVLPFMAILVGVVMFPIAIMSAIGALVGYLDQRFFAAPPTKPPPMQPRTRTRNFGVNTVTTAALLET